VTSPAFWLALRELAARRSRVALAVAVVATIAAAVTATELVARAREEAIGAQIDAMGPALTIVPRGTSAGALARYDLAGSLPPASEERVRAVLGRDLRSIERRLVLRREVAGVERPVVGAESLVIASADGTPAVAIGSELARLLGEPSSVALGGRAYRVDRVLPSAGGIEDLAVFLPLDVARALGQVAGVNELRLFLRAGISPRDAAARLSAGAIDASVIRADRGDVADGDAHASLARHRGVAYLVMASVAALCLLIAAHLDAAERRLELATLVAIGASRSTILGGLLVRSGVVAGAGAALGTLAGALLAAHQDPGAQLGVGAWALAGTVVGAGVCVGLLAAGPTALAAVARDPVHELQEG
jgi:hypothetical protein